LISEFVGFATVGVNMRGSGCSGGVIGLFDLPATADGYDIVRRWPRSREFCTARSAWSASPSPA
jgi:predicted acyl esterase